MDGLKKKKALWVKNFNLIPSLRLTWDTFEMWCNSVTNPKETKEVSEVDEGEYS